MDPSFAVNVRHVFVSLSGITARPMTDQTTRLIRRYIFALTAESQHQEIIGGHRRKLSTRRRSVQDQS